MYVCIMYIDEHRLKHSALMHFRCRSLKKNGKRAKALMYMYRLVFAPVNSCYCSVSPKGGYQGAPPFPSVVFFLMWSLECLIYFDLMEKL